MSGRVKNIEANIAGTERAKGEQRVRRFKRMGGGRCPPQGLVGLTFAFIPDEMGVTGSSRVMPFGL